ncbi:MAG TPA: Fur family transcriptional regulator [Acidimicrobiales bacterium]|nr:Fur family transcriptional regulator [Acidimicrobiales bacterium]
MATTDLHATTAARLGAVQQRYTPKRRALVDLLADAGQPLAIPDILTRGASLAQSSVYRNLVVLEQAGVVRRVVSTDDYARYELAEDLTEHHHHLICSSCGSIDDFTASSGFERTVAKALVEVAKDTGFDAQHHRIDLIGVCARCA